VTVIYFQYQILLLCPLPIHVHYIEEVQMTRFKFLFFLAVLAGFAALACAGSDEGKAAYDRGDYARAHEEFKKFAELGDSEAQYFLGRMFDKGEGVPKEHAEAMKWYLRAANQGNAKAQFNIGLAYQTANGVPQDYAEAVKWFRKAADQGDAEAQCGLGNMYGEGHGVPQDYAEAVNWCRKAAEQGNSLAQATLGWAYADGNGVPQDYVQAYMWFILAARQGYPSAEEYKDKLTVKMTPSQIAEAQRLAGEWKPKSP
jgi:uncharacterized protein